MSTASQLTGIVLLAIAATAMSADKDSKEASEKERPPIAKSPMELAKFVTTFLDEEKYDDLKQLLIPEELLIELGAPEKDLQRYRAYRERLPKLARQYREYLQTHKLLPLAKQRIKEIPEDQLEAKEMKGKKLLACNGIRLTDGDGKLILELIDHVVAIDGRWYVDRLCIEQIERELQKATEP